MRRKQLGKRKPVRRGFRLRLRTPRHEVKTIDIMSDNKFALFGCWGVNCQPGSPQKLLADDINKDDDIDFIVAAGDNFYVNQASEIDFQKNVLDCYSKPMYAALGNHDILYYDLEKNFRHPRWNLPDKNFVLRVVTKTGVPRLRVVVINTNPIYERQFYTKYNIDNQYHQDLEEVNKFLDHLPPSDLFTIIVGHHPLVTNRHKEKGSKMNMNNFAKRVSKMCNVYVCADEHNLQHIVMGDLNEFIIGGGGSKADENIILDYPDETKFTHPYHGYGVFDVKKLKLSLRCLNKLEQKISKQYVYKF